MSRLVGRQAWRPSELRQRSSLLLQQQAGRRSSGPSRLGVAVVVLERRQSLSGWLAILSVFAVLFLGPDFGQACSSKPWTPIVRVTSPSTPKSHPRISWQPACAGEIASLPAPTRSLVASFSFFLSFFVRLLSRLLLSEGGLSQAPLTARFTSRAAIGRRGGRRAGHGYLAVGLAVTLPYLAPHRGSSTHTHTVTKCHRRTQLTAVRQDADSPAGEPSRSLWLESTGGQGRGGVRIFPFCNFCPISFCRCHANAWPRPQS